jgi:hypothetical protein
MHTEGLEVMVMTEEEYRRIWQLIEELENLMWKVKRFNEIILTNED